MNFAVHSSEATCIELCLFGADQAVPSVSHVLPGRTGAIWHGLVSPGGAGPGTGYAFRAHGPSDAQHGRRFDPSVMLLDPCARQISARGPRRSLVIDPAFDWEGDRAPAIPWRDGVIYELHVKGYTQLHPEVPAEWRGKYLGLTAPAVIEHLRRIGVSAVELLPCQFFLSERFLLERGLSNYWGYNPAAWFAPANEYALEDAVREFKVMVRALHRAGIEVILDVVFNHTAEGDETGPVLSFKGLDNAAYYRLLSDPSRYENLSGCGNTVNCEHPQVRASIVECLKYWVAEMHVDGFRFDLATVLARDGRGFNERAAFFEAVRAEPALASIKLIAEPWDVGQGGYQLGRFPCGWSEWNDRFRDTVRSFWRRDPGRVGELAERLAGSSDLFRHDGRTPSAGINYITSHDGFTLNDLVSYEERRNLANGESNGDGHHGNLSWNCGVEGPTEDPGVKALRRRQRMNMLATLLLSQGVPMLQAGDEMARTQLGNNNAYCQDNRISWVDWTPGVEQSELIEFVRCVTELRRTHPEFRRDGFLDGAGSADGFKDVAWLHPRGTEMMVDDWRDPRLRTLGMLFARCEAGGLLLLLNADDAARDFVLPTTSGPWACRFDTAHVPAHRTAMPPPGRGAYPLGPHSAALLES